MGESADGWLPNGNVSWIVARGAAPVENGANPDVFDWGEKKDPTLDEASEPELDGCLWPFVGRAAVGLGSKVGPRTSRSASGGAS